MYSIEVENLTPVLRNNCEECKFNCFRNGRVFDVNEDGTFPTKDCGECPNLKINDVVNKLVKENGISLFVNELTLGEGSKIFSIHRRLSSIFNMFTKYDMQQDFFSYVGLEKSEINYI